VLRFYETTVSPVRRNFRCASSPLGEIFTALQQAAGNSNLKQVTRSNFEPPLERVT